MLSTRTLKRTGSLAPGRRCRDSGSAATRKLSLGVRIAVLCGTLAALCGDKAWAQLGPGPLSRAHADLEGVTKCSSCHDFGARGLKCLECHAEIRHRLESGRGFHPRAYKGSAGETDCARCHAEHRGPGFDLIALDRRTFDHLAQTGFALEGKHREQKCEACHNAPRIAPTTRSEIRMKNPNQSFLGLRRECTACHQEPHRNPLGTDCVRCHVQEAWKPASRFSHSRASFPLSGLHQQVKCEKCHSRGPGEAPPGARSQDPPAGGGSVQRMVVFKGLSFSTCQSCHSDRHGGAFQTLKPGSRCDSCHDTSGWKSNRPGASFNHNLAKFRLAGRHLDLTCGKCHKQSEFGRPVAHSLCRDCHDDPHKGQFAGRAAGSDCSACHSVTNFKPAFFDRDAHMKSAFPLVGKHSTVRCVECHKPPGRDTRYKTGKLRCPDCHAEPHAEEFAAEPHNNNCDQCHTPAGFETTTFTPERHSQTRFQLTGRHADAACQKCHKPLAPEALKAAAEVTATAGTVPPPVGGGKPAELRARRQYRFASRTCDVCHTDPHRITPPGSRPCETCHVLQDWKAPRPFDHSQTLFRLDRSHLDPTRPIPCVRCHKSSAQADGTVSAAAPLFSGTPSQCSGCHREKDAHGGQFSVPGNRQRDCSSCHSPTTWTDPGFDHDSARFALDVAHRRVGCVKCHKEQKQTDGRLIRAYRDTPLDCLRCH